MKKRVWKLMVLIGLAYGILGTSTVWAETTWHQSNNQWHLLSNGTKLTGWQKVGTAWYYLGADGVMRTGWQQVGAQWFFLNEGGDMATGWQQIGGAWYYFHPGGDMATGWLELDGSYFFLNEGGDMATGWKEEAGRWYYLGATGRMVTGRHTIDGKHYVFLSSGVAANNQEHMLVLVNEHRAANGRAPLSANTALQSYANIRLAELAVSYSHTRPNGEQATTAILRDYGFQAGGENIAYGYPTVEDVFAAWRASEGHNRNMLSTHFSEFAFATDGYYAVQLFSR